MMLHDRGKRRAVDEVWSAAALVRDRTLRGIVVICSATQFNSIQFNSIQWNGDDEHYVPTSPEHQFLLVSSVRRVDHRAVVASVHYLLELRRFCDSWM
jgi:hypothetical protein